MDSLKWGSRGLDSRPFAVQRHNLLVYLSFLLSMLLRSHEESLFIAVNFAKVAKPDYTLPYRLPRAPYSPPAHLDDASTLPLRLNRRATPFSVTRATTTGATSSSRCPLLQYSPRRAPSSPTIPGTATLHCIAPASSAWPYSKTVCCMNLMNLATTSAPPRMATALPSYSASSAGPAPPSLSEFTEIGRWLARHPGCRASSSP